MSNPVIADNKPVKVSLSQGQEYHFCTCGKSKSQPFCDGSHVGTSFNPRVIVADKDGEAYLCACKHTANTLFVMVRISNLVMSKLVMRAQV